jgi:DNA-directed RNA polymerase specialized sigma24 family protein
VLGIDPALRSALTSLPEGDLHLLTLVVFEDLSLADAAAVLHITESAAKTRLHRVRQRLRAQLGDLDTPSTTQGGQR